MDLYAFLEPTVHGLGYELVDLEAPNHGRMLRLFIDKPEGITLDDCELVSNQVARLLEVENIDYDRLEVSSPGLDRPLRKEADFQRFSGEKAQVRLRIPLQGQRNFTGVLRGVQDGNLQLEVEGALVSLEIQNIAKARLIPNI